MGNEMEFWNVDAVAPFEGGLFMIHSMADVLSTKNRLVPAIANLPHDLIIIGFNDETAKEVCLQAKIFKEC